MPSTRTAALAAAAAGSLPLVLVSPGVSYGVRTATAGVAIVALLRVGVSPGRRSRQLLAAALAAGVLSGLVATAHLLVTGHPSPPGAASDWVYLSYGPLAIAGLLALPRHASAAPWRLMALADAAIAASTLGFLLSQALFAATSGSHGPAGARATTLALAYPLGAVSVLAVLLSVLARAQEDLRPFLRVVGLGLALMTVSDVAYGIATLHHRYTPTTWPAVVAQAALVSVALAPLLARRALPLVDVEPAPPTLLETAGPYLPVLPACGLLALLAVRGEAPTPLQLLLVVTAGAAMVLRGLLTGADQRYAVQSLRGREREALTLSLQDPLTGLGNRTALNRGLAELLARHDGGPGVALALLDLDDFKDINDTHGHETGDAVLREVARRLRLQVDPQALVARLGGDEFAVCVSDEPCAKALGDALLAAFDRPVAVGNRRFAVTASIGVVRADADGAGAAVALSHVDVAMYEAKAGKEPHRSTVVVLDGRARAQAAARVQLREEVSHPDLRQFRVVYEPVVDLADGSVVGAEALLRWDHPVLGSIPPSEFVALAEQVGGIGQLGEFALRQATADLAGWIAEAEPRTGRPLARGTVGVNLSPRQLGLPGLCDLVRDVLEEHRLAPYRLVLEITEEALLDDWATAVDVVSELRSIGVAVAVDDFGTGYSSLRYLRRFDTSTVKVDREFVQAVADEPRTRALVASVLQMARSLDLYTVAEGIETLDQLQVLRSLGCLYAQGHLFDRPMSADAFGALLLGAHRYPMGAHPRNVAGVPVPREQEPPRVVPAALPVIGRQTG